MANEKVVIAQSMQDSHSRPESLYLWEKGTRNIPIMKIKITIRIILNLFNPTNRSYLFTLSTRKPTFSLKKMSSLVSFSFHLKTLKIPINKMTSNMHVISTQSA